ncbi:hypothetical protein DID76_04700 [Candidatus Marinamargulisbacteria bacterium SCGC AG-414-C22]|nr:hypothetical protein DID76_04700 [Candidatus Marinamargulisbacteria bacterium SCGC AG-414-C22]
MSKVKGVMMLKKCIQVCAIITCITYIQASPINDISQVDSSYSSIKKSINLGYLSLYNDNTFRPDQRITRKEMAVIIDLFLKRDSANQLSLTQQDIDDLLYLSKSYRNTLSSFDTTLGGIQKNQDNILAETKLLHYDNTTLNNELNELKKQNKMLWLGIGVSALIGVLF